MEDNICYLILIVIKHLVLGKRPEQSSTAASLWCEGFAVWSVDIWHVDCQMCTQPAMCQVRPQPCDDRLPWRVESRTPTVHPPSLPASHVDQICHLFSCSKLASIINIHGPGLWFCFLKHISTDCKAFMSLCSLLIVLLLTVLDWSWQSG